MIIFEKKLRNLCFQCVDFFYVRNCNQLQKLSVLTPEVLRVAGGGAGGDFPPQLFGFKFLLLDRLRKALVKLFFVCTTHLLTLIR